MADPEGFEPSIRLLVYSLSRGALSTAQPQVQEGDKFFHKFFMKSTTDRLKDGFCFAFFSYEDKLTPFKSYEVVRFSSYQCLFIQWLQLDEEVG